MTQKRKRTALWMFASVGLVATAGAGVATRAAHQTKPQVMTVQVTRGEIVQTISATGSLAAVRTVAVGSQVSGRISALRADFDDVVRKGQVLAELDPSMLQAEAEQAQASLASAEAEVERLKVEHDAARTTLNRTEALAERQLVSALELETAQVSLKSSEAGIRSAEASVAKARASLNQARVNLGHTVITSPIDGTVISRAVDAGQTVAASLSAPTLFTLAADLTHMRVSANIDESDVSLVEPGQAVTFRVDAYPDDVFQGKVAQVRLEASTSQNVVTYATVIDVDNPELKLMPGMTTTISIEVARRADALQVPSTALRVRPSAAALAALGGQAPVAGAEPAGQTGACGASRNCATLWLFNGSALSSVAVRTGITNGTTTEILTPALAEGDPVVSAITVAASGSKSVAATVSTGSSRSPLLGSSGPPPPGGGGPPR
jgi:HlyD family secretion protein